MEMKKIACAIIVVAAFISATVAHNGDHKAPTPAPAPTPTPASAPAHSGDHSHSGAAAFSTFVGASLLSFVAYYLQF